MRKSDIINNIKEFTKVKKISKFEMVLLFFTYHIIIKTSNTVGYLFCECA